MDRLSTAIIGIICSLTIAGILAAIKHFYRRKKEAEKAAHIQSLADEHPQPAQQVRPKPKPVSFREGYTKSMAGVGCMVMGLAATIFIDVNRQYFWAHILGWMVFSAIWVCYSEAVVDHAAMPPLTKSPRKDRIIGAILCVVIWAIPSIGVLYFAKGPEKGPERDDGLAEKKMWEDRRREADKKFEEAQKHLADARTMLREQEQVLKVAIDQMNGTATEQEVKEAWDLLRARGITPATVATTAPTVRQK